MVKLQVQKKPLKKPVKKSKVQQKQKQSQNITVNIDKTKRASSQSLQKVIQRAPQQTTPSSYTNFSFSQPSGKENDSILLRELFAVNKELQRKINALEKAEPLSKFEKQMAKQYNQASQQLDEQGITNEYTVLGTQEAKAQIQRQKGIAHRAMTEHPLLRGLTETPDLIGTSHQVAPGGIFRDQLEASLGVGKLPYITSIEEPLVQVGGLHQLRDLSTESRLTSEDYRAEAITETRPRAIEHPELKEPYNSLTASLDRAASDGLPSEGTPILERLHDAEDHANDAHLEEGISTYAEAPDREADGQAIIGQAKIPNRIKAFIGEQGTIGGILEEQRGEQVEQLAGIAKGYAAEGEDMEEGATGSDAETVEGLGAISSSASAATENIFTPKKKGNALRTYLVGIAKANGIIHSDVRGTFSAKKIREALDKEGISYDS